MAGKAICGELPFHWETDFDFSDFGGWKNNQEGHSHERDLLVIIPEKTVKKQSSWATITIRPTWKTFTINPRGNRRAAGCTRRG